MGIEQSSLLGNGPLIGAALSAPLCLAAEE